MPELRVDDYYRVCVGAWQIQPSEFWGMTLQEFWWVYDARKPPPPKVGTSGFTAAEVDEIAAQLRAEKAAREAQNDAG